MYQKLLEHSITSCNDQFFCYLCTTFVSNITNALNHMNEKQHQMLKSKQIINFLDDCKKEKPDILSERKVTILSVNLFVCLPCTKSSLDSAGMLQHIESEKHIKSVNDSACYSDEHINSVKCSINSKKVKVEKKYLINADLTFQDFSTIDGYNKCSSLKVLKLLNNDTDDKSEIFMKNRILCAETYRLMCSVCRFHSTHLVDLQEHINECHYYHVNDVNEESDFIKNKEIQDLRIEIKEVEKPMELDYDTKSEDRDKTAELVSSISAGTEEQNIQEILNDNKITVLESLTCHICKCSLPSYEHVLQHIKGKQHTLAMKQVIKDENKNCKNVDAKTVNENEKQNVVGEQCAYNETILSKEMAEEKDNCDLNTNSKCKKAPKKIDKKMKRLANEGVVYKLENYECTFCKCQLDSLESAVQHTRRQSHKLLKKSSNFTVMVDDIVCDVKWLHDDSTEELTSKLVNKNDYRCGVCNIKIDIDQLVTHIDSLAHMLKQNSQDVDNNVFYKCFCCKLVIQGNNLFASHLSWNTHLNNWGNILKAIKKMEHREFLVCSILIPQVDATSTQLIEKRLIFCDSAQVKFFHDLHRIECNCSLCGVNLPTNHNLRQHCKGKMHKSKIKQLLRSEKKNAIVNHDTTIISKQLDNIIITEDTLPKTKISVAEDTLPKTKISVAEDTLPKTKIFVAEDTLPKTKISVAEDTLSKTKISVAEDTLSKTKISATEYTLPKTKISVAEDTSPKRKIFVTEDTLPKTKMVDTALVVPQDVYRDVMRLISDTPFPANPKISEEIQAKPREKSLAERLNKPYCKTHFDIEEEMFTVNREKLKNIESNLKLVIPFPEKSLFCLACNTTVSIELHILYEHVRLQAHIERVNEIKKDAELKKLSEQYMKQTSEDVITCYPCRNRVFNSSAIIDVHIKSSRHNTEHTLLSTFIDNIFSLILEDFKSVWYSIQRYSCVLCKTGYKYKLEFIQHIILHHSLTKDYVYDFCIPCATLWLGHKNSYAEHCSDIVHKYLLTSKDFMIEDLSECIKKLLNQADETVDILMQQTEILSNDNIHEEVMQSLENTMKLHYPSVKAHLFGSRLIGLAGANSDIDIYLDCGGTYYDSKPESIKLYLLVIEEALRKQTDTWEVMEKLDETRTPILKLIYKRRGVHCDISVTNGLSVEKSKLIRSFIDAYSPCKQLILFVKKWFSLFNLPERHGLANFSLVWLVIFFLQSESHLPSVTTLIKNSVKQNKSFRICGWEAGFAEPENNTKSVRPFSELLLGFFKFYANFDYQYYVICPLMGCKVAKKDFTELHRLPKEEMKPYIDHLKKSKKPEYFRIDSSFCLQDPFDLSHNLTKAVNNITLKCFKQYCQQSVVQLSTK